MQVSDCDRMAPPPIPIYNIIVSLYLYLVQTVHTAQAFVLYQFVIEWYKKNITK